VKVNGKVVNEFTWSEGLKREGSFKDNLLGSGTFALQGHDPGSEVHFRNIMVKPLPSAVGPSSVEVAGVVPKAGSQRPGAHCTQPKPSHVFLRLKHCAHAHFI
jgi:hypothetical protein